MKIKAFFMPLLMAGTVLLTGCAKYKPKSLDTLPPTSQKEEGISVRAAVLTQQECKRLFNSRSPRTRGYVPIQLTISNNLSSTYKLEGDSISLDLVPARKVAYKMSYNTVGRILGWGIAGIIFPLFFIPALIEGTGSAKANKAIREDLAMRTIDDDTVLYIKPHSRVNKVIFVEKEDYRSSFEFDLINQTTKDREQFRIDLKQA